MGQFIGASIGVFLIMIRYPARCKEISFSKR